RTALLSKKRCAIVVFGLINFRSFFKAREEAERKKEGDQRLYPYLEACYRYFASMMPNHRQHMIELGEVCNRKLTSLCNDLARELQETEVRVRFSDAMAKTCIDRAELLSPADAWHPSLSGHRALAKRAYQSFREQAEFLGWTSCPG